MVLGYLLLGWIGGFVAVLAHLTTSNPSLAGATGIFVGTSMAIVVLSASAVALQAFRTERQRQTRELTAPVYDLARRPIAIGRKS